MTNEQAVAHGIGRTGRVITAAAVMIAVVFLAFGVSPVFFMKQIAVAQAVGVLIAHRRARRAGRPVRPRRASGSARSSPAPCSSTRRDFNLTRESRARLQARARDPGLRHPAGLRHRPPGRDPGRQQDRPRPDRGRHRRRRRHHLRRPDRASARTCARCCSRLNRAKTLPGRLQALAELRPGQHRARDPAERRAAHRPVDGRARRADRAGVADRPRGAGRARRRLAPATSPRRTTRGFLDDLVTPFRGLERDQNLRADSSLEKLAKLKPVFGKGEAATMTAGNSTPLTDGASAVLLASEEWAAEHGLPVLAYLAALRDRRGRLRARRRGPADGSGVRRAADARARRA